MLQGYKQIFSALPISFILSFITWLFFKFAYPEAPLETNETIFIVIVWTLVVLIFKTLMKSKKVKQEPAQKERENESA